MEKGQTKSSSISSLKVMAYIFVISLWLQSNQISAQFTQTYGWGGAGHGKRSLNTLLERATATDNRQCLPNKRLQNYIIELIQGELERLRRCRDSERLHEENLDNTSFLPNSLP